MTVPYQERTEPAYAETAVTTFEIEDYGAGVQILRGLCPRCAAAIEIPVVSHVVKSVGPAADRPPYETVMCMCEESHDGRPEGRVGCGAYWNLEL
jgi:hypothetical protein